MLNDACLRFLNEGPCHPLPILAQMGKRVQCVSMWPCPTSSEAPILLGFTLSFQKLTQHFLEIYLLFVPLIAWALHRHSCTSLA